MMGSYGCSVVVDRKYMFLYIRERTYTKRCRQKNRGLIISVRLMLNEFQVLLIYYLEIQDKNKKFKTTAENLNDSTFS